MALKGEAPQDPNKGNHWLPRRLTTNFRFNPVTKLRTALVTNYGMFQGKQICLCRVQYIHRIQDLLGCTDTYPAAILERVALTKKRSKCDKHHVLAWIHKAATLRAGCGPNRATSIDPFHPKTMEEEWHTSH
eukprot:scaffold499_cov335-Pavlova_lutheri.AAC.54